MATQQSKFVIKNGVEGVFRWSSASRRVKWEPLGASDVQENGNIQAALGDGEDSDAQEDWNTEVAGGYDRNAAIDWRHMNREDKRAGLDVVALGGSGATPIGMVCYPDLPWPRVGPRVFLAGTSEPVGEPGWRDQLVVELERAGLVVVSPRPVGGCDYGAETDTELSNRKDWERRLMDAADYVLFHFVPGRESSVSLMELGLYASVRKLVVSCPVQYAKSSSVRHTCIAASIPLYTDVRGAALHVVGSVRSLPSYYSGRGGCADPYGL